LDPLQPDEGVSLVADAAAAAPPASGFCTQCGTPRSGRFCATCGRDLEDRTARPAIAPVHGGAIVPALPPGTVPLVEVSLNVIRSMKVEGRADVAALVREFGLHTKAQEEIWVVSIDGDLNVRAVVPVARGGFHETYLRPATVMSAVLLTASDRFVLVHNHPSGILVPSAQDKSLTAGLLEAAKVLHLIVGPTDGWLSMRSEGLMAEPAPSAPENEPYSDLIASHPDLVDQAADPLLISAFMVIREYDRASASLLQRTLRVEYARGSRMIDQLEERGYIGQFDGVNAREVLRRS
jgi:DNA repair protein RadC